MNDTEVHIKLVLNMFWASFQGLSTFDNTES